VSLFNFQTKFFNFSTNTQKKVYINPHDSTQWYLMKTFQPKMSAKSVAKNDITKKILPSRKA